MPDYELIDRADRIVVDLYNGNRSDARRGITNGHTQLQAAHVVLLVLTHLIEHANNVEEVEGHVQNLLRLTSVER